MKNYMKLTVNSFPSVEALARSTVAAFCTPLNPTVDQISDVKTAVSEAVTNCMVHAYEGREGEITVEAYIESGVLHITVTDFGVGIENVERAREPFFSTKSGEERTGMGFTVMESFMDSIEVTSRVSGGTVVKMSKVIGQGV